MKGCILCNIGLENICINEIKEYFDLSCIVKKGIIVIEDISFENLCELSSMTHTAKKTGVFLGNFDELDFEHNLLENKSLAIRTTRYEDGRVIEKEKAVDFCKILDSKKINYTVDLKNPDNEVIIVSCDDEEIVMLDLCGYDLDKRDYLVFRHNQALRPTIAASMIKMLNYDGKGVLLDPFCGSGTICIEASLLFKKGLHHYDYEQFSFLKKGYEKNYIFEEKKIKGKIIGYDNTLSTITCARKNAKIAGIIKSINFSSVDAKMLDLKFEENSVNYIVTHLPHYAKNGNVKKILKLYDEFLYIASDILIKKMVLICNKKEEIKEFAKEYPLKLIEEIGVYQGKTKLYILIFDKNEK